MSAAQTSPLAPAVAVYNGSATSSRRTKANRMPERTLLPRQNDDVARVPASAKATSSALPAIPAAKRGRKPASATSALSRSAREAQRKLNHSIIEKARRTKINEALGELARLSVEVGLLDAGSRSVTVAASKQPAEKASEDEETDEEVEGVDGDDNDDDYEGSSRTRNGGKGNSKSASDSNSKGKDKFKLDILVRTVEDMRLLLGKVKSLESELNGIQGHSDSDGQVECAAASANDTVVDATLTKRKRPTVTEESHLTDRSPAIAADDHVDSRDSRRRKLVRYGPGLEIGLEPDTNKSSNTRPSLPSISSWLSDTHSPSLSPNSFTLPKHSPNGHRILPIISTSPSFAPYLPSPPSSTQFSSSLSPAGVPLLELGPSSVPVSSTTGISPSLTSKPSTTASISAYARPSTAAHGRGRSTSLAVRTPEEKHAVSLLLHMKTSPPEFTMTARANRELREDTESLESLPPSMLPPRPSFDVLDGGGGKGSSAAVIVQTPSSILGLGSRS
ncbi:hypothetical protein D9757_000991 [Collybiopsis confluens]|uniref:BHLH domain-containing protein n=1 Tax=Collybiopsis confluens TaxID=2823264 RepID=A0A8H5I0L6_9AGAR|nr:hypothetical protein D9757_000991 [Collybiopsis confluens]